MVCEAQHRPKDHHDDQRQDRSSRASGEGSRHQLPARDDRLRGPAPDGAGDRRPVRRRARRTERGPDQPAQWLPGPGLADTGWHGRAAHSQAAPRVLLPRVPGAAQNGGEGADRGDPGGLRPGRLHPQRRRPGAGDGHGGHQQEPGLAPVRRDRRAGAGVPHPPDRGGTGPTSGWTRPTSKPGATGTSSRWR